MGTVVRLPLKVHHTTAGASLREQSIRGMAAIAVTHRDTFVRWTDHRPPLTTPWCPLFTEPGSAPAVAIHPWLAT